MECPYCNISWEGEDKQYCPSCGKLVAITVHKPSPKIISIEQIVWLIAAGFSAYYVLLYIVNKVNLPFSIEVYLGLNASFIMAYRVFILYRKSDNDYMGEFFPYFKEFFIITGVLIWFSAFWIKIVFDFISVNKTIDYSSLGLFTFNFFEGYALGLLLMLYFYYRAQRKPKIQVINLFQDE